MRRGRRTLALAAAALACVAAAFPATAAKPKPEPAAMTAQEQTLVQTALDRGSMIYAYDQAAWHGTDDLRARIPERVREIGGWIVDGPADAPHIVFIDKNEADPHALYEADFKDGKLTGSRVLGAGDDRSLSPSRKAMAQALRTARKAIADAGIGYCVQAPFNTVVLPPSGSTPTLVYFLTPQTKNGSLPFAGHYLVEVSADGRAGPVQRFTKGDCAELSTSEKDGKRIEGIVISDLLHLVPTEIHVFSSMSGAVRVYVVTVLNDRLWAVEGPRIRLLPTKDKGPGRR